MSPLFIKLYKDLTHCPCCKASPKEGYICCPKHLEAAKLRFQRWSTERKSKGLCCYCNRKSYKGYLRCKPCTIKNRIKCHDWFLKHPEHSKEAWEKKKLIRDSGFCPGCPQHRPLLAPSKRCVTCHQRRYLYEHKVKTDKNMTSDAVQQLYNQWKSLQNQPKGDL
jgi:hypothetical protein